MTAPGPKDENPMTDSSAVPSISKRTILIAGLSCDVYGLDELAAQQPSVPDHVSVLWLHHPRNRAKEDMGAFAVRAIGGWKQRLDEDPKPRSNNRGLVAVAFDQRNHGGRLVEERANKAWRGGNETHALDMFGAIAGMVDDTRLLMDLIGAHLKIEVEKTLEGKSHGRREPAEWRGEVDHHCLLGVSLGGHSAWQALFAEERISAAIVIIGCPDFMALLSNRARLSKRASFKAPDNGSSFLGSRDFPPDLVRSCLKHDPKGILFGTGAVVDDPASAEAAEQRRLRETLISRLAGKKALLCSGGADKLVPYAMGEPFIRFMERAAEAWTSEGKDTDFSVENKVYEGIGHEFSPDMVLDSLRFLLDEVASVKSKGDKSKI